MLSVLFRIGVLTLSLANLAYLLDYPPWYALLLLLPAVALFQWRREWLDIGIYRTAQALLALCALSVVGVLLQKLLQDLPPVVDRLFPVAVASLVLYLLVLYQRENRLMQQGQQQAFLQAILGPPILLSLGIGVITAVYLLLVLAVGAERWPALTSLTIRFTDRGIIPPITLVFFCWALILLMVKWFIVWRRWGNGIWLADALANSDTKAAEHYLAQLWGNSNESYLLPRYISWAIPILGFIGTVLGISLAAAGIQGVISSQQGLSQFSSNLGDAISPLGIAFDTTLIALSLSVVLTLLQTLQQRWEERLLAEIQRRLGVQESHA